MNSLLKKIFGTLAEKPWEANQAAIDTEHSGQTFNLSNQMSAVIIIFGISSVLFSLIFTGYLYSLPPGQDTTFILKTNLVWINTLVLILVTYFFDKIRREFNKSLPKKLKKKFTLSWSFKLHFFITSIITMVSINDRWKICFNEYILFIFLFFYCITWTTSLRRIVFLGKSYL